MAPISGAFLFKEDDMSKEFWKAAGIRAIRTVCQTAVGMIPAAVMITDVDWKAVIGTAALSGLCSILMSIGNGLGNGLPEVDSE